MYENGLETMPVGVASKSTVKTHWSTRYAKGADEGRISVISGGSNVHSGSRGLKIKYPKHHRGTGDSGATWETKLGVHEEELYLAYWIKFDKDFDFQRGGKLPGLGGTFSPFPGDGQFRIRLMWRANGAVEFYLHDYAMLNKDGEEPYRHWWNLGGQRYFKKGQWHHIEIHVKLNTPGRLDGVLEGWFDGDLAFRDTDSNVGLRGVGQEDRKINYLCWHTFFGGSSVPDAFEPMTPGEYWGPPRDVYSYFDDFVVSTQRIGNGGGHDDDNNGGDDGGNDDNNRNINYVKNSSFESGMSSWKEWGNGDAGYVQSYNPYEGGKNLAHWKNRSYEIGTYQNITGIPNGTYKALAWVKSTGGQTMCKFYVNGFNSWNTEKSARIWKSSTYKLKVIKDIQVTNGKCNIAFYSKSRANKWATFDAVTLIKQ